jgi:hypothetical protein
MTEPPEGWPDVPGYRPLAPLGAGGMGAVYRVADRRGREWALKTVRAGLPADRAARARERLRVEVRAMRRLTHPGIVTFVRGDEDADPPYFVMELCPGGSLAALAEGRGPLAGDEAVALLEPLVKAVEYAHGQGVAHRDLTPNNVLRAADGRWKLTDFGLAKRLARDDGLTATGCRLGTESFAAPEQWDGRPVADWRRADVYSLGALLLFLLTGAPPRWASRDQDVPDEPAGAGWRRADRRLRDVCLKCLRRLPRLRYADATELLDDLRRFRDGGGVRARPVGFADRGLGWWARHRARAAVAAAAAALAALALAPSLWHARHQAVQAGEENARLTDRFTAVVADAERFRRERDPAERRRRFESLVRLAPDGQEKLRLRAVELLPLLLAENDRPALAHEIEELTAREAELDDESAKYLLLMRADPALHPAGRCAEARGLLRRALERPGRFAAETDAYAQGLALWADGRTLDALARLAEAGPDHHRAGRLALRTRLERGEYDEARRLAGRLRAAFPRDPLPPLAEAMADLVAGDGPAAAAKVEAAGRELPEDRRAALGQYWAAAAELHHSVDRFANSRDSWENLRLALSIPAQATRLRRLAAAPALEPAARELSLDQRLVATADTLILIQDRLKVGYGADQVRRLREANARSPEAILLQVAIGIELETLTAGGAPESLPELRDLKDLSRQAADTPTLYPQPLLRYRRELIETLTGILLPRVMPDVELGAIDELHALIGRLVEDGARWPAEREEGVRVLIEAITAKLTPAQSAAWHLEVEENRLRFKRKQAHLVALGHHLLEKWERAEPGKKAAVARLRKALDAAEG